MDQLEVFRATLEAAQRQGLIARGHNPDLQGYRCRIKFGRKYANVDTGGPQWSGKYMVDLTTGAIYGIKGYGVIHHGHRYGTVETIANWDWSGYTAVPRKTCAA